MKALITGVTGMCGSYLAELLIEKGFETWGMIRRTSTDHRSRIKHIADLKLIEGDMTDPISLDNVIRTVKPDWVMNLAAQSFVGESWNQPLFTFNVVAAGVVALLESVRRHAPAAKFYQSSSSEMFGSSAPPQSEHTIFHPRSPYGVAKLAGHWAAVNYRESYNMFIACGITFNMEGPRRGQEFVTRKISQAVADIYHGRASELRLGNLAARRDWGYARDYMKAAIRMLEQDQPGDYVIGTGEAHTVEEFVDEAFKFAGLDWREYVVIDEKFMRPAEVNYLLADPRKAQAELGWFPSVSFHELVRMMVEHDMGAPHRISSLPLPVEIPTPDMRQ